MASPVGTDPLTVPTVTGTPVAVPYRSAVPTTEDPCAPIAPIPASEIGQFDDETDVVSNAIDVHIAALRRKLGADLIRTRRGEGYVIDA